MQGARRDTAGRRRKHLLEKTHDTFRRARDRLSKKLKKLKYTKQINRNVAYLRQIVMAQHLETLKSSPRYEHPKSLIRHGRKVYSQNEEDGIIQEIFRRVNTTNKVFVEVGVGDGLENNTLALVFQGWEGLWIEGSQRAVRDIQAGLRPAIEGKRLQVVHAFAKKNNIDRILSHHTHRGEIDLLSIDIDGNDVHIFNAIKCINPRVVVIEYNAKYAPPILFNIAYDDAHRWNGDDYMGASLKFLELNFAGRGYRLVGCDLSGTNAFFVRDDLVGDVFLAPFTAEQHYEPARYHMVGAITGPPATYDSIGKSLSACLSLAREGMPPRTEVAQQSSGVRERAP